MREHAKELGALALVGVLPFTPLYEDKASAGILLEGLSGGALLILHALAVVLVFRTGRFLHLAQVPIAFFCATLFTGLANGAPLLRGLRAMCQVCLGPQPGGLAQGINFLFALAITLAVGVFGGMLVQQLLLRRFFRAPRLMPTLVTIFLGQALVASQRDVFRQLIPIEAAEGAGAERDAAERAFSEFGKPVEAPFSFSVTIGDVELAHHELLALLLALVVPLAIGAYLRWSSAGIAIRASAENAERAQTLGLDSTGVTSRIWAIVGGLAALSGMLIGLAEGAQVDSGGGGIAGALPVGPLVLVLAIAVAARLTDLPLAVLSGVVLALVRTATQWSFGSTAPFDAVLGLAIAGLLLLQREPRVRTDEATAFLDLAREPRPIPPELRVLPVVRTWLRGGLFVVVALLVGVPWIATPGQIDLAGTFLITAMVGMSLLVLTGWSGQISLGQWGFATIGGWTAAASGLPLPIALVLAALVGAVASVVVGYPALKLRGLQLAIATLAFAYSTALVFTDPRYLGGRIPDQVPTSLLVVDLSSPRSGYYGLLVLLGLFVLATIGLRRSRLGRALIAVRTNAPAAESYGIDPRRLRLSAFAVSGSLAAMAGALFVAHQGGMVAESFLADESVQLFSFVVIGGLGGVLGPILGALFLGSLTLFSGNELLQYLSAGVGGLVLLMFAPGGLAEIFYRVRDAGLRRLAIRNRIPVASLLGDRMARQLGETAPLRERGGDEGPLLPPLRYELPGQWALERYGRHGEQPSPRAPEQPVQAANGSSKTSEDEQAVRS